MPLYSGRCELCKERFEVRYDGQIHQDKLTCCHCREKGYVKLDATRPD
jgi:predicted nucleic acid-binding Zn ribbon protein